MKGRNFPVATVTKKAAASIKAGHPWVYEDEIISLTAEPGEDGLADVASEKGAYLGTGFFSPASKIRIRILSDNPNETFSPAFWERRVKYAVDYRRTVMGPDFSCCRLVFGEADGIPGLTVDRYGDILVTQVLSACLEPRRDIIYGALVRELESGGEKISGIYERNDVDLRDKEGLTQYKGWYEGIPHSDKTETEITENGIVYTVDFENGQKTGFFLDQKYNRLAVARIAAGKKVLDCFTHTGSFALNAAKGGAQSVTAVDVSETAIAAAKRNAAINGLDGRMDFVCEDVFEFCQPSKIFGPVVLTICIYVVNNMLVTWCLTMKSCGNNSMDTFPTEIHVSCNNIRCAQAPHFIQLSFAHTLTLMSHYGSIITNRIVLIFIDALFNFTIIINI